MTFKNVLLLYKRSAYKIYFLDNRNALSKKRTALIHCAKKQFEKSHQAHYESLRHVSRVLLTHGVRFTESYRGRGLDYSKYDLVITIGGDGTFLEAARHVKHQAMLGVNSAPDHSVGRFCVAHSKNFENILEKILSNKHQTKFMQRLSIKLPGQRKEIDVLNDVLVCHSNPAMLSRYYLEVGRQKEEQRSSGVWISTAAGSTGAIRSAGGKVLPAYSKIFQYRPRELYQGKHQKYRLIGGNVQYKQRVSVISLIRRGAVYLDGAHHHYPFDYGDTISVGQSGHPVKIIMP